MRKKQSQAASLSRRRPVSCNFCRVRKLRCSRQSPCSNCTSHNVLCQLGSAGTLPPDSSDLKQSSVIDRLERLEAIVLDQSSPQTVPVADPGPRPYFPRRILNLSDDAKAIETTFAGPSSDRVGVPGVICRISPLHDIATSPSSPISTIFSPEEGVCWLPTYDETKFLVGLYIRAMIQFQNVVFMPWLMALVEEIYRQLDTGALVSPGPAVLLLSIIASTISACPLEQAHLERILTPAEAKHQSDHWIKATLDVIDLSNRSPACLEGVQGIIIIAYVITGREGVSARFRHLVHTAILSSREIGLHRTDYPEPALPLSHAKELEREIRRRVWWYLVGTDWSLTCFAGAQEGIYLIQPRQMAVKRPRNANDDDLTSDIFGADRSLQEFTCMTYFIFRTQLAELIRGFVDRVPFPLRNDAETYKHVLLFDMELEVFKQALPLFFQFGIEHPNEAPETARQRYMLNHIILAQRCKLHIPYLVRGAIEPTYTRSRKACLDAARELIHMEKWLESEDEPPLDLTIKFPCLSYGVFLASIALVLDKCLGRSEESGPDLRDACQLLSAAGSYSKVAANVLEALKAASRKYSKGDVDVITSESQKTKPEAPHLEKQVKPCSSEQETTLVDLVFSNFQAPAFNFGNTTDDMIDWERLFADLDPPFA